jgi:spermidine synthase
MSVTHIQNSRFQNAYLYLCVFVSGMSTLAIELSASRLLGNVFGTSNIVWANVIGLILLYLTVGYFIGGRWADRSPYPKTFYQILIWGAFLSALVPLVARPVLTTAATAMATANAGVAGGSFISVLILFSVPVVLLGCVSPFAIRLAVVDVEEAGRTAGFIYGISTLGSLIGTFLPVLILIPELGTTLTFLVFAGLLYLAGLVGLWRAIGVRALAWLWMPLVITILYGFVQAGPLRPPFSGLTLLYEGESPYNYIQVQEDANGTRYLFLNEGQGIHSQWNAVEYGDGNRTWSFFLTAPYFNAAPYNPGNIQSVAIVGLAAGTIARQYIHVYGDIPIDGIEIDPGIVDVGARYFGMNPVAMPSLTVYTEDGRYALKRLPRQYSVIALDAYRPPYIPWHLTTVEFFREVESKLLPDGVVAINVGRTNTDRRLVDAMTSTLLQVFPSVHAMDVPRSFNTILVATRHSTLDSNLASNLVALSSSVESLLLDSLNVGVISLMPIGTSELVFTDDRAPLETLVDSLVIDFLLSGGVDMLTASGS